MFDPQLNKPKIRASVSRHDHGDSDDDFGDYHDKSAGGGNRSRQQCSQSRGYHDTRSRDGSPVVGGCFFCGDESHRRGSCELYLAAKAKAKQSRERSGHRSNNRSTRRSSSSGAESDQSSRGDRVGNRKSRDTGWKKRTGRSVSPGSDGSGVRKSPQNRRGRSPGSKRDGRYGKFTGDTDSSGGEL